MVSVDLHDPRSREGVCISLSEIMYVPRIIFCSVSDTILGKTLRRPNGKTTKTTSSSLCASALSTKRVLSDLLPRGHSMFYKNMSVLKQLTRLSLHCWRHSASLERDRVGRYRR